MPGAQANPTKPAVLVIIPCLNEASNIPTIARQLLEEANRIPLRIVIADGGSTDGTREFVQSLSAADDRVLLLDNEKRIQSAALNKAVQEMGREASFSLGWTRMPVTLPIIVKVFSLSRREQGPIVSLSAWWPRARHSSSVLPRLHRIQFLATEAPRTGGMAMAGSSTTGITRSCG